MFLNANMTEVDVLMLILEEYCLASVQLINYHKSFIRLTPNTPGHIQDSLKSHLGNGHDINFCTSHWIPSTPDFYVNDVLGPFNPTVRVSDFIINKEWNVKKLKYHVPGSIISKIKSIPISQFNVPDIIVWHFTSNGNYTVKSGYYIAQKIINLSRSPGDSSAISQKRIIWKLI